MVIVSDAARVQPDTASATVSARSDGMLVLSFAGVWTVATERPSIQSVLSQLSDAAAPGETSPRIALDGRGLTGWDSQFLVFLRQLTMDLEKLGAEVDSGALPDGAKRLLALASAVPPAKRRPASGPDPLTVRIGKSVYDAWDSFFEFVDFVGGIVIAMGRLLRGRAQFPAADFALIIQDTGARALPIVSLIAVLVGLIIAFVGSVQLQRFGAGSFTADMVAIAMLREMGALMTAVIMAGRTGAAFAAEIATMQVNEEIDALATLGIDPMDYLVLPRVLALSLMMPLLCLYANLMGILGGGIIGVTLMDIPVLEYWERTKNALGFTNLAIGVIKAGVFGGLIGLSGCMRGLSAGRSAAAVGVSTTSAVVLSIVLLVVCDGLFAVILNFLGL
jgi:phospholipid/cholesterol/gamma-HCH transport system permease protein